MTTFIGGTVTRVHWYHPEWSAVAVSVLGWVGLLAVEVAKSNGVFDAYESHMPAGAFGHAALMAAAMMAPLVLEHVHRVATFSLWRRRYRAAAGFLLGYLSIWTLVGTIMIAGAMTAVGAIGLRPAIAVGFVVGVAAMLVPGRDRRLRQCLSTRPLAPRGWRADRDTLLLGWQVAYRSVLSCWPLMLATAVSHSLLVMAAAALIAYVENRSAKLTGHWTAFWVGLLGLVALVLASLGGSPGGHVHTM
jgi:hypothetical protein